MHKLKLMSSLDKQALEKIQYRHTELQIILPYLSRAEGALTNKEMIEVVEAVFDKSRRAFINYIIPLKRESPSIFGLARTHLSGLRYLTQRLQEIKLFDNGSGKLMNHAAIEDDINMYLRNAHEDIKGVADSYSRLLTKPI